MKPYSTFVRSYGIIKLNAVSEIYLYATFIINPRYAKSKYSVRFYKTFYYFCFFKFGMSVINIFN